MAAVANVATGYVWEDPGDSIMIEVSLDVIERLGAAVQYRLGTGPRGLEIGGILLGRILPGFGRALIVEDFELSPCEHLRGASYTLSPKDRRLLGSHLARRNAQQVVGYFRSHTRPGMYLDQEDFAVFSQYFAEPWQVFLLVKPSVDGPATGGFFFWEDGDINRRAPYRTFPFDSARIAQEHYPIASEGPDYVAPVAHVPRVPAAAVAPVLVSKRDPNATRMRLSAPEWGRKLPSLPWVVVPLIAILFLIAGLFVSEKPAPTVQPAAVKSEPPVEPLLPEPLTKTPAAAPVASQPVAAEPVSEGAKTPDAVAPVTPKPAVTKKPRLTTVEPPPVKVEHVAPRAIEPPAPPPLASQVTRLEPPAPVTTVHTAPPPEAEVTYEAPRPGVFRRALHKIEGSEGENGAFVPPAPTHKVRPVKPAGIAADERPVDVKVSIDDTGAVSKAQVMGKGGDLAAAALTAARQWQFKPARKHGKPVASEMVLHFKF